MPAPGFVAPLPPAIFKVDEEVVMALEQTRELEALEIHHLWSKFAKRQRIVRDPDSRRAENFWWHVWGSDRKHLPPRTLAKLFDKITEGPTFAPLPVIRAPREESGSSKWVTSDVADEELKSSLKSLAQDLLGSSAASSFFSSSSSSTIVANQAPQTPPAVVQHSRWPVRLRRPLSPSAKRPNPPRSILKKTGNTPCSDAKSLALSPSCFPEDAIENGSDGSVGQEDDRFLEPPQSLIASTSEFTLDPSWCAGEAAKGKRQDLRALRPCSSRTASRAQPLKPRPVPRRAAPSDPAQLRFGGGCTEPTDSFSSAVAGPRVRVVGFRPYTHPSPGQELGPEQRLHHGTFGGSGDKTCPPQAWKRQYGTRADEPRPLLELGPGWGELPRTPPLPAARRTPPMSLGLDSGRDQALVGSARADTGKRQGYGVHPPASPDQHCTHLETTVSVRSPQTDSSPNRHRPSSAAGTIQTADDSHGRRFRLWSPSLVSLLGKAMDEEETERTRGHRFGRLWNAAPPHGGVAAGGAVRGRKLASVCRWLLPTSQSRD